MINLEIQSLFNRKKQENDKTKLNINCGFLIFWGYFWGYAEITIMEET